MANGEKLTSPSGGEYVQGIARVPGSDSKYTNALVRKGSEAYDESERVKKIRRQVGPLPALGRQANPRGGNGN